MTLLFDPQPSNLAKTCNGDDFLVRRIFCVGAVVPGDKLVIAIDGLTPTEITVGPLADD